jgi:adenylate cyclase
MPATPGDASETTPNAEELLRVLVKLGVDPEAAADAVRRGDPESAVFEHVLLPARLERTISPAEIERRGGLPVLETSVMMLEFGLPRPGPDDPTFTPAEAEVFVELNRLRDIWPAELAIQLARVYGRMLSRVAGSEVQAFRQYTVPHLRESEPDTAAELRAVQAALEQLLPLADPLLLGVHRRWVEHELAQEAVRDAEARAGVDRLPGATDIAFLFCDLKDFTRYAADNGDAAAIGAIERFFNAVTSHRGETGRVVKALGDGAMLTYDDPAEAVRGGARVIAAMRDTEAPGVHASVHHGVAIARQGDYFGSSVNLAARLLALGGRDELIASDVVAAATASAFKWESLGEHSIRGVARPLTVYRLVG